MFSICPQKVYKNKALDGTDIKVYLAIQGFADENGFCFPSVARIADICGVSKRTVFRSLKTLESFKLLAREQRMRNTGGNTSNAYYLKLEPDASEVTSLSRGECQPCHGGGVTDVTPNKNQYNQNIFKKQTARAYAHAKGRNVTAGDLAHVNACVSEVENAVNYNFFLSNDVMCVRPRSKFDCDAITESKIISFFEEKYNESIRVFSWDTRANNEVIIGG